MACNHKFINYLQLQRLRDFKPCSLIIGTFNPEWPVTNSATWFYGRTRNNYFWDLFPRLFGDPGLRAANATTWKDYCKKKKVVITDLVQCVNDANPTYQNHMEIMGRYTDSELDKKFKQFVPNPIIPILESHPSITSVYITTTAPPGKFNTIWQPIAAYCADNGLWCQQLMTPSKGARFFMTRNSGIEMPDFIFNDWRPKWNPQPCKSK